jgi:hypothetical protein
VEIGSSVDNCFQMLTSHSWQTNIYGNQIPDANFYTDICFQNVEEIIQTTLTVDNSLTILTKINMQ